jgi:HlyD family secretion protein
MNETSKYSSKVTTLRLCRRPAAVSVAQMLFCVIFATLLHGCGGQSSKPFWKTYEVRSEGFRDVLHFSGNVQPIRETTLTCPVDGILEKMNYAFGQKVKKDDVVFVVNSQALQKQYNDALTEYLKAKDNFTIAKTKFIGTDDLWKAGLIAKNNYLSEKSNLNTAHVTLMQALHNLSELVEKTSGRSAKDLTALNLEEFEKVQAALSSAHHLIQFKSPIDGIVLYPPLTGDMKTNHLSVGSTIKAGQALALIGDLSGIRVEIDIPEVDIDKIKPGLLANIRGVAFNQQSIQGELTTITSQASVVSGSALPSFQAIVEVHALGVKQQAFIRAGMSATVEIAVSRADELMIPIAAVHVVRGESMVKLRAPDGSIKEQPIITGDSKADSVVVLKGLKPGDVVVYE